MQFILRVFPHLYNLRDVSGPCFSLCVFLFQTSAATVSVCLYETGVINRNLPTWLMFELSSFVDFGKDGDPTNLLDRYWARIEVNKLKVFLFAYFLRPLTSWC